MLEILRNYGVVTVSNRLSPKYKDILASNPQLLIDIEKYTDFIQYDCEINVRLRCIIDNITTQPLCPICNTATTMRTSGRLIYTFNKFCCNSCVAKSKDTIEKRQDTNIQKYGSTNYLGSIVGKERTKKTNIEKYGVEYTSQSQTIRNKIKTTNLLKYGVENALANPDIIKKRNKTNMEKYGVENVLKSSDIRNKIKGTNIQNYGVDNLFKLPAMQQYAKQQMKVKYGAEHALQVEYIHKKFTETMMLRYGVEYAHQNVDIRSKFINCMLDRYGVDHPSKVEDFLLKAKQTYFDNHDLIHPSHYKYDPKILELLYNRDWLYEQHHVNQYTLTKIAEIIGVQHSTVGLYFRNIHNIPVIHYKKSQIERDALEFLTNILDKDVEVLQNNKRIISPLELDIYVPQYNIAIELNGLYWHGETRNKNHTYHLNKTNLCNDKGIRLLHITDHEWYFKTDIVQSRIRAIFHQQNKIGARNTEVGYITSTQANEFCTQHHLQGHISASHYLGLTLNGELISVMSFGKPRYNKSYQYELIRFCSKHNTTILGGASKLFNFFIKNENPSSIISYSDKRWNTGDVYSKLGFNYLNTSEPNYWYFKQSNINNVYHRANFQKHKLASKLDIFDANLTEWQNMQNNGYDRIWDCGNDVWVWTKRNQSIINTPFK